MANHEYPREISKVTITVDRINHTIDVEHNDLDQWNNMMTCVLGLGILYNRCINQGYEEEKVYTAMTSSLLGAIANFKSNGNGHKKIH